MDNSTIEAMVSGGFGLRVEFVWHGDRFAHVISLVHAGIARPLLESVEGQAAHDWPSSPPLQSLRVEMLPGDRPAALLLGLAGRSHWSASVEPASGEARLIFDVACRHPASAVWLGSRYRWLVNDECREGIIARAALGQVIEDGDLIQMEPPHPNETAGTARWQYTIAAPTNP